LCLQNWLNIVLDLLAAAIATSVVAIAVAFRGRVSGAQVGIALNIMLVANTTLLKLVQSWTSLETSLGAIARLKTLEEMTPFEGGKVENLDPPENWPPKGHIEFKNITASYKCVCCQKPLFCLTDKCQISSESVALRNLSLDIPAGQKLIVCGRTGRLVIPTHSFGHLSKLTLLLSGKSTLLLTLLRLLELQSGKIELDGIDIKEVRLELLRGRCFVAVSQDPLILPNEPLRFNLDPDGSVSDDVLIEALTKAGLWPHFFMSDTHSDGEGDTVINISGSDEYPVLDRKVSLFQELSVGQCQLFAMCRALVKVNSLRRSGVKPVIILDEVTSSLDTATESTIHHIIDDELTDKGHTVIIVTHRLGALEEHTETGRDAVALMADGRLQEVVEDLGLATFQRFGQMD
jgi:ATP-binding cassette, subfamily C (CFTR/MRP), member 1